MIKQIQPTYNGIKLEKAIQETWKAEKTYEKTKAARADGEKFYFVDGPPYTTGHIHLGTAFNKTIKDILIRYWRMNGYNVRDQPGFDMHGLPIEVQVEKLIGIHSKKEIEEMGIDKFVTTCQDHAFKLHAEMTEEFKQLGAWFDWNHPYQTLRSDYIESAWWTLQRAYDRGLLNANSRVVTWCPRCETALAEAEIEYWDETDPSVMVRFPLRDGSASLLIWTTTPWTLPSNMAVAAHPDFEYARVRMSGEKGSEVVIILASQAEYVMKAGGYDRFEILETMNGKALEGLEYIPPFELDAVKKSEWTFKVVNADYVEQDNTGLVHTAPGHGPDDYDTGKRYGMEAFCPVAENGRYTDEFPPLAGKKVKTVNEDIIRMLTESKDAIYNVAKIKHRYGHCWRCKSPIIYRNTRQWFVNIPEIKEEMLGEIDRVKWVPDWAGSTREKNWVDGAREWCISRQRYWGIPLPVWECECGRKKVVGQYEELKAGEGYTEGMNPHRPWIDGVTFKCECGKTMHRVPDVLDVWFDSGVAAWASLGYPHHKEEYDQWWPPKFIVEAHDQTRGWFYSQLGAGCISMDRAPYNEVMMHGWVLDPKGQKMSKSKGNVINPLDLINEVGADSMRFYLIKSNAPWEDTAFQKEGPKNARKVLNTLWNVVNFASTYMILDKYDPDEHPIEDVMPYLRDEDLWMISRTEKMKAEVTRYLESRELHKLARTLEDYIMEDLSRWYVCLVRDRSWSEDEGAENDKIASYFTLYYAIMSTTVVLAPIAPHITEEIYRSMDGGLESVHMESWPVCDASLIREDIERSMSLVQKIDELVASERAKASYNLRWPLLRIMVRGKDADTNDYVKRFDKVLSSQTNSKQVVYLAPDQEPEASDKIAMAEFDDGVVFVDFTVTPEIEAEALAREVIRRIQQMRKDMKLKVDQFIACDLMSDEFHNSLLEKWKDGIATEVRAQRLSITDSPAGAVIKEWEFGGKTVTIGISPIE